MLLEHVLSLSRVEVDAPVSTKKRLLEHVAALCAPSAHAGDFFEALLEREKLGSTSLGHGVALPHARVDNLTEPVAVFVRLKTPIDYDSHDEKSVDLIFGLFVPQGENTTHLHLLSQVASRLNEETTRAALRSATSNNEIWNILIEP